ncbi:MAG: rRNA maturation RNase YbeY [Chloroflexi bacterium]|nr:rRNA maturation RNase YbeY [Chloroflexota bacterium]
MATIPYRVSVAFEDDLPLRLSQRWIRDIVQHVLAAEKVAGRGRVEVLIAGDDTVRQLNAEYLGEDSVTDVLSFPADGGDEDDAFPLSPGGWKELGQLVVCLPQAERQAKDEDHPLLQEVGHLIVHGTLHVLGYDHQEPADSVVMRGREEELLRSALVIEGPWSHGDDAVSPGSSGVHGS